MATAINHTQELISSPAIIHDQAKIHCRFNVMNEKFVEENFNVKEYRIWDNYGEAEFDRTYFSSMEKSPDHLIFLTGLIHTQKLLYLVMSKHFGFEYEPHSSENFKIWPTSVSVQMPKMVRKSSGVIQRLFVHEITHTNPGRYEVTLSSDFEGVVTIESKSTIFMI